ncbi:hypothetical protein [Candidatus Xianfuyuplasma coldseepsis]|uniref:Uncharacterized protein n=1 Tax=Candidatus Xianfuyuplasma coldseepsis TaxID=2782163 RepID=A0A7L7KTK4_9MOLU|nr:hypothetical protein [Xianfuyuplasma coldseepsis]QMS85749.1 hypothetical protein G4Z02_08330 [Xianfuyuplasma coldseepsis]
MNRNIFAYLLLLGLFSYILHEATELPYIMAFIVIAPLAIGISFITIPPIYFLLKGYIIDQNYEAGNVSIVVALVEIGIILPLFQYIKNGDLTLIPAYIDWIVIGVSLLIDVIAFFLDYYKRWVYVIVGAHIIAIFYIFFYFTKVDFFFIQVALYYLLVHTIFSISYLVLRHILKERFPYVSKWKI